MLPAHAQEAPLKLSASHGEAPTPIRSFSTDSGCPSMQEISSERYETGQHLQISPSVQPPAGDRSKSPPLRSVQSGPRRHTCSPIHCTSYSSPDSPTASTSTSITAGAVNRPGARTAAEKAREKYLRDDPTADVQSPFLVDCRRCGARIKLSAKSLYDTLHWRTHRMRCLKRHGGPPPRQPAPPSSVEPACESPPSSEKAEDEEHSPDAQPSTHAPSSLYADPSEQLPDTPSTPRPRSARTPSSDDAPSQKGWPPSPMQAAAAAPIVAHTNADKTFHDYLRRSHSKDFGALLLQQHTKWQDWKWSQLLLPEFVQQQDPSSDDSDGELEPRTARLRHPDF